MRTCKLLFLTALFSTNLMAQDLKIVGSIDVVATAPKGKSLSSKPLKKNIKLMKIELSDSGLNVLKKRANTAVNKPANRTFANTLPTKIALGMNNVPVLDQGSHGSCVTFASTAAIDAALDKGDYVSQLCNLQLGSYLEKNGFFPSGWNGSSGRIVLNQIEQFGIVSKDKEKSIGCGGMNEYPIDTPLVPDASISPEEYHQISEGLENSQTTLTWSPILDIYEAVLERTDTNKTLNDVKAALNNKDRVTFAVLLFDMDQGFMGAVGTHKSTFDTWTLTPELTRDLHLRPNFGGHEMVITGYDDDAITTDEQGRQYKGLLTLRNSWSEKYGDKGDFYMTYDYFKVLVYEAQRIRNLTDVVEPLNKNIG